MYDETGHAVATFVLQTAPEANYAEIEGAWLNEEPYLTIHRVAAEASAHGVMRAIQSFAETKAAERGIANLRIDTHERNESMRHVIALLGYTYCGHIVVSDGTLRLAFQKGLDNVAQ